MLEEMQEEGGFLPPHGLLSMEFRRVRGDPACMTERVRRDVVNSIPAQIAPFGERSNREPGAVSDACMCLEGLWCALFRSSDSPHALAEEFTFLMRMPSGCVHLAVDECICEGKNHAGVGCILGMDRNCWSCQWCQLAWGLVSFHHTL